MKVRDLKRMLEDMDDESRADVWGAAALVFAALYFGWHVGCWVVR